MSAINKNWETNSERVIALRIVATVTLLFICYPPLVPLATIGQTLLRGQRRNGKNNIIKPKKLIFAVSSTAKLWANSINGVRLLNANYR